MTHRSVSASILLLAFVGCADDPTRPTTARTAAALELVSGAGQSARVGEALALPIVVRVLDPDGAPLAGQTVEFAVPAGGGGFVPGTAVSDAAGLASSSWVLGAFANAAYRAEIRLVTTAGVVDTVQVEADARPGALHSIAIAGDTLAAIQRGDTLDLAVVGADVWGNALEADSFEVAWQVSDSAIASVADGRVIGLADGDVVVTALSAAASARVHVDVEGTRATRFELWGVPVSGDGRLLVSTVDSLYEWDGTAFTGAPLPEPISFSNRIEIAPATGELWALVGGAVYRSTDGVAWTASLAFDLAFNHAASLGFTPDGAPVVAYDSTGAGGIVVPRVLRLDGADWVSLDLPRVVAGDTVVLHTYDVAVAGNGDVYVGGFSGNDPAAALTGRPYLARYDGSAWTFLEAGTWAAWIAELEPFAGGVFAHRQTVNGLYAWDVLRVEGGVVENVPTPVDATPVIFEGLAVRPDGGIAFTYYAVDAAQAGAAFQTAAGWDTWQDPRIQTSPLGPVWHDGDLWFPLTEGFSEVDPFVVRLEPQP